MNIGEFFVTLGVKADTINLKQFVGMIGELPALSAAGLGGLAAIEHELVEIGKEAMNAAVGFQMFGAETGLSWKELQKWQVVAVQANISAETVASSVTSLQRQLAEIRLGRGNIAPFQLLGISPNQDAFSALKQIRERIKGLNPATATNLVSQMGIDPSMIHLLQLTDQEFAKLSKTVGGMTGEQEGSFLRLKQNLVQFGLVFKQVGIDIIGEALHHFYALWDVISKIQVNIPALAITIGALAVAFSPLIAGIVALLLVLDDFAVFFEGGDSQIGQAIEGIKTLGQAFKDAFPPTLSNALSALSSIGSTLANPIGALAQGASSIAHTVTQNVTMNINSTAPAHDVGKAAAEHLKRATSQAALSSNQQGY